MPEFLESINDIARQRRRDVLFLTFCSQPPNADGDMFAEMFSDDEDPLPDWENDPARQRILQWLDAEGIPFQECFGVWSEGLITAPYNGTVYIDIPYDPALPEYRKLSDFLEDDDQGKTKWTGVVFCAYKWKPAKA